jgi:glutaredoxin
MERARPLIFYRKECAKSKRALEYLESRRVGFERVEIGSDEGSLHRLQKATGQTKTPTLLYDGEHIHDFGLPELAAFLDKYQLDKSVGR